MPAGVPVRSFSEVEARRLVTSSARHGVSALVADFLAASMVTLPSVDHARLQSDARNQIHAGLRIRKLTLAALDALAREGVVPVLLKGSGLAERLYPEQPLARPASDVDVLVTPAQLPAAERAMASLGLARQHDEGLANVMEEHHHVAWGATGRLVEVHFRLFSGFGGRAFDEAFLRSRLRRDTFHGREVLWLHPEDEFVYLATHAANHGFLRASWLVDLQRALRASADFDWVDMARRCADAGFHSAVSAALCVLAASFGVQLPAAARRAFACGPLRAAGHRHVFSAVNLDTAALAEGRLSGFVLRLWLTDSARAGLRHAVDGGRRLFRRLRAAP